MQASTRTPNSILRRRSNKENEDAFAKAAKRNKLATRRVSFAPDDELETKHIFKEDRRDDQSSPGNIQTGLQGMVMGDFGAQHANASQNVDVGMRSDPAMVLPSPGGLSPMSMDLTNNSFDQGNMSPILGVSCAPVAAMYASHAGPSMPQRQQQHMEFTRNITMNVPNLSTLVEEDEEEYDVAPTSNGAAEMLAERPQSPRQQFGLGTDNAAAGAEEHYAAASPISPFVLREMQRGAGSGEDDEVRNRWGFTPGADDTLDVSFGRAVMGEATYNHVYGAGTTGDLTKAIKDGHTGGHHFGHHGVATRALASITAVRGQAAGALMPPPAPRETTTGLGMPLTLDDHAGSRHGAAPALQVNVSFAATLAAPGQVPHAGVLAPQLQTQHGRSHQPQGEPPAVPAVAALPRQQRQVGQQPLPASADVTQGLVMPPVQPAGQLPHCTPFAENTIRLLEDDQTDAWRLQYGGHGGFERGRLSVASNKVNAPGYRRAGPAAAHGGGETTTLLGPTTQLLATGNMPTAQLLADTTNHKAAYERFLRNMPGHQGPQSTAPAQRPGRGSAADATAAVSSSGAELRRMAVQDHTDMSMEMQLENTGTNMDLLADGGGLSLDAFAVPPEPTLNLSQQYELAQKQHNLQGFPQRPDAAQQGWHGQVLGDTMGLAAHASGGGQPVAWVSGAQAQPVAPAEPPARRLSAPKISCQDFLCMIDVSFNDKVCRTSYLPQSDPPPKSVAEVYEAAHVVAPYVSTYQAMMLEVSGRLASMQSRVQQLEGELSANNPDLFTAVQLSSHDQLESMKEQMIGLKKLCRIRTVKAIKQTHLASLDNLLVQMNDSKDALQAEVTAMSSDVERLNKCVQDKANLTASIARRCQEDDALLQGAIQKKKAMDGHLQRLEVLRNQNAQRMKRMEEARAEYDKAKHERVPNAALEEERRVLEARAAALASRGSSAMTPGREGNLVRQVSAKREELEALLSLHALRVDMSSLDSGTSFKLAFRDSYELVCSSTGSMWDVKVARMEAAHAATSLGASVISAMGSTAGRLSCTVPCAKVQQQLETILQHLHRQERVAQQLQDCHDRINCLLRPYVENRSSDAGHVLVLDFVNANTVTKVTIRLPWESVLNSDATPPLLDVSMESMDAPASQQQYCEVLKSAVLSRVPPGAGYLRGMCFAMSATLEVSSGGTDGQQGADAGAQQYTTNGDANSGAFNTGKVFDNPLFTVTVP